MSTRPIPYDESFRKGTLSFFRSAFAEAGFQFDLTTKDQDLNSIPDIYQKTGGNFWIMQGQSESQIVGAIGLRRLDANTMELKRFFVLRKLHGNRIGAKLLSRALDYARLANCKFVRLDTTSKSQAAIHLFKKVGFEEIGRYNDDPYAEHFFECLLDKTR